MEFLSFLIRGLRLQGFDWQWERRVQIGLQCSIRDQSAANMPPVMYIDPEQAHAGWITLQALIHTWHEYMGMHTAFTGHPNLVCVHIDRTNIAGNGDIYKSDASVDIHGECELPFFPGDALYIKWLKFSVVAAIAHLGQDRAGHCRSVLRVDTAPPESHPAPFLLTDDNTPPVWIEQVPTWFASNIMCVWLRLCPSQGGKGTFAVSAQSALASSYRTVNPAATLQLFA